MNSIIEYDLSGIQEQIFFELVINEFSKNFFKPFCIYNMDSNTLVSDIKFLITYFKNIPAAKQQMVFNGKILKDDRILASYKINSRVVIQLLIIN